MSEAVRPAAGTIHEPDSEASPRAKAAFVQAEFVLDPPPPGLKDGTEAAPAKRETGGRPVMRALAGKAETAKAEATRGETKKAEAKKAEAAEPTDPLYHGHRQRLRERFDVGGSDALADYEMMELLLFRAMPRRDVKPLAKALIARFGSFPEALAARRERLREIAGMGEAAITELKIVEAAARRLTRGAVKTRTTLGSWTEVLDYCRATMAFAEREEFRVLFLDKRNVLITDEVQGQGTVDHTPVYPREVVRRALELGATALVLVHNHPSGDPTPSTTDIRMTHEILAIAKTMGIEIHDHLIVGRGGHSSLRALKFI